MRVDASKLRDHSANGTSLAMRSGCWTLAWTKISDSFDSPDTNLHSSYRLWNDSPQYLDNTPLDVALANHQLILSPLRFS